MNLKENFDFVLDFQDKKADIEKTLNSFKKQLGDTNEAVFHNLFNIIYLISGSKTHLLTTEVYSGHGKIDSFFYPKDTANNNIIIKEFKYTENIKRI